MADGFLCGRITGQMLLRQVATDRRSFMHSSFSVPSAKGDLPGYTSALKIYTHKKSANAGKIIEWIRADK
ncbi:hypothetical protein L484_005802 [Morus notabilis]|uniref:Uncharacterized protein n=1 Tax=Morus notabilis TaxID=981085 RepID=W9RLK6_9ROSA|nr:hypothetical protein L484_005802 [Morus notabilis]